MSKELLRFISPHKLALTFATLLGVLTVASNIGLMATSGYLIAAAALHPSTVLLLWVPIVGIRFFGIARAVFRYGERYVSHDLTFRILANIRVWFYDRLEPLVPLRLADYRSGDVLSGAVADVDTLQDFYLRVLAPPLVAVAVAALVLGLLASFSMRLGLLQVLGLLLAGFGVPLLSYWLGRQNGNEIVATRTDFAAELVDFLQGAADVLAFSQEQRVLDELNRKQRQLVQKQTNMAAVGGLTTGLMTLLNHLSMWAVLVVAIPLIQAGVINGVDLTVIVQTALASFEAVLPLPFAFLQFGRSFSAMRHLLRLLDAKPRTVDGDQDVEANRVDRLALRVEGLCFGYSVREPDAVHEVSFTLRPGEHIAIVGPSGAGKSSLVQVLARFYEYRSGSVKLGHRELRDLKLSSVRKMVAVAPQSVHLFNASIMENLRLAKPDATADDIGRALRIALASEFVENLSKKTETLVGEQGFRLSGGERQRLAIARAVLAAAPISVFDEPTSGLDAITEEGVLRSVHAALAGKSLLWISHRLTGLQVMDRIIVMNQGRIVGSGRHEELLAADGLYRQMWDAQQQLNLYNEYRVRTSG